MKFIFFSAVAFDSIISGRSGNLARELALEHEVHFVEMPSLRRPVLWPRHRKIDNITIHRLPPLPRGWRWMSNLPGLIWCKTVNFFLRKSLPLEAHAIVSTPFWSELISSLSFASISYDCLDHISIHAQSCNLPAVIALEEKLLTHSDRIFAVSHRLQQQLQTNTKKTVYYVPNACPAKWLHIPLRQTTIPTAGFLGSLYEWVDYELLHQTAVSFPGVKFILAGPVRDPESVKKLRLLDNVTILPELKFDDVPNLISNFSVALIPFKRDLISLYSNPLKMYEYLSLGKPTLTTIIDDDTLPLTYASSNEDFINQLRQLLSQEINPEKLRQAAVNHTWKNRARQIIEIIKGQN